MLATAKLNGAEFDALPYEEGRKWELLDGDLIEVSSPTPRHQKSVGRLFVNLEPFLRQQTLGDVLLEVEYALGADIRLRPDMSILLHERSSRLDLDRNSIPGAPNIAIEVISPSERSLQSLSKVRAYLRHGAEEVWQFYPQASEVLVHSPGPAIVVLRSGEFIETPLIPGWRAAVSELFLS